MQLILFPERSTSEDLINMKVVFPSSKNTVPTSVRLHPF